MRYQPLGLFVSLSLHSFLIALVFAIGSATPSFNIPISLDFQLIAEEKTSSAESHIQSPKPSPLPQHKIPKITQKKSPLPQQPKKAISQAPPPLPDKKLSQLTATPPTKEEPLQSQAEDIKIAIAQKEASEEKLSDNASAQPAQQLPDKINTVLPQKSPEPATKTIAVMREHYIKENYALIQNSIQKMIHYPRMARKMGWEGKVVVCFEICKDGHIENMRIIESSGSKVLDKNALEAIKQAAPFSMPPAKAELTVPVIYRLRDA